jgi:hypothetical protein
MANTLTDLIPDLYEGLDVVSREITGFIPSVSTDNTVERAALNEVVRIPQTQPQSAADNTPAVTPPDTGDQTIDNTTITIDKSRHVPIRWNGEQTQGYSNNGLYSSTLAQQTAQAIRTLVNEIEADIAQEYLLSSRAFGTAGTTPFATSISDANQIAKILTDNGTPLGDRHLVVDTTAGVNLRDLTTLNQQNTAGTDATLRQGVLLPLSGLDIRESAQVQSHTAGTAAGATTDATGYAVGTTSITLASAGTGTILAGDVITFAGDTNKYLVVTGDADVSGGGTIVIAAPGLRQAIPTSATAITVSSDYTANIGFHRTAIHLATRMPAQPIGGDLATATEILTDPNTGLSFEVAQYKQFLQNSLHVRIAWGTKLIKPEHTAILLG